MAEEASEVPGHSAEFEQQVLSVLASLKDSQGKGGVNTLVKIWPILTGLAIVIAAFATLQSSLKQHVQLPEHDGADGRLTALESGFAGFRSKTEAKLEAIGSKVDDIREEVREIRQRLD